MRIRWQQRCDEEPPGHNGWAVAPYGYLEHEDIVPGLVNLVIWKVTAEEAMQLAEWLGLDRRIDYTESDGHVKVYAAPGIWRWWPTPWNVGSRRICKPHDGSCWNPPGGAGFAIVQVR